MRLQLRPLTTALMVSARARSASLRLYPKRPADEDLALAFAKAARPPRGAGVGGGGRRRGRSRRPVTPEAIDALLEVWPIFEAFQTQYVARRSAAGTGKKRLRARAEWSFGGGDSYCAACPQTCQDCPARLNQPVTFEGWQVWDSDRPPWWATARDPRRGAWVGHGCCHGPCPCAGHRHSHRRRTAA